jgi:hypothetical protein
MSVSYDLLSLRGLLCEVQGVGGVVLAMVSRAIIYSDHTGKSAIKMSEVAKDFYSLVMGTIDFVGTSKADFLDGVLTVSSSRESRVFLRPIGML